VELLEAPASVQWRGRLRNRQDSDGRFVRREFFTLAGGIASSVFSTARIDTAGDSRIISVFMQFDLLYSPIDQLADIELVWLPAVDLVDRPKFLDLRSSMAEFAQDFPV
jgi:hypothetical protein